MRHGTPLASRGVPGERGHLSSCIWNLGFFPNDARKNWSFVLTSFTGWSSERCPGIGFLSRGDREIGVLRNRPHITSTECKEKLRSQVQFQGQQSGERGAKKMTKPWFSAIWSPPAWLRILDHRVISGSCLNTLCLSFILSNIRFLLFSRSVMSDSL